MRKLPTRNDEDQGMLKTARNMAGAPGYRRLWKWLTAGSRAKNLQLRAILRQERDLADVPIKEFVEQQNLPKEFTRRFFVNPTTRDNMKHLAYNFETQQIGNLMPGQIGSNNLTVKPTDALLHEVGHAKSHLNGSVTEDFVRKRFTPSLFTAVRRLFHPETSDLYKVEDAADKLAFGQNGQLSWHKQLRRHPAIAGYRAAARAQAAAQLISTGLFAGSVGYNGMRIYNKNKDAQELTENKG